MELSSLFADNMVLQAKKKARVFGRGMGAITVEFCGKTYAYTATEESWFFELDAFDHGGPYEMKITLDGAEKMIKNVYVGEVLLCTGQSNMEFNLEEEKVDLSTIDNEKIRFFVLDSIEKKPLGHKDGWMTGQSEKRRYFSALGYHVADILQKRENIAVGAICCHQGSSNIQSWIRADYLTEETYVPLDQRDMDGLKEPYSEWTGEGKIYVKSFSMVIPYAVSRVIWYQGESNTSEAEGKVYIKLLEQLVQCWRTELKDPSLPFIIVQICDYIYRNDENWRAIQRAQADAPKHILGLVTVTSSDVCEHDNIHPQDKRLLAEKIGKLL